MGGWSPVADFACAPRQYGPFGQWVLAQFRTQSNFLHAFFFCRYLPLSCWNQVRMLLKGRLSAQQANSARANSAVGRVFLVCCTYIRQSEWGPGWKMPCGNNEKCFYSVWLSCMIALLGKWKTTMKLFSRDQFSSSLSHLFDMGINKYTLQMICVPEMRRFIYLVSLFTNKRRLICGH